MLISVIIQPSKIRSLHPWNERFSKYQLILAALKRKVCIKKRNTFQLNRNLKIVKKKYLLHTCIPFFFFFFFNICCLELPYSCRFYCVITKEFCLSHWGTATSTIYASAPTFGIFPLVQGLCLFKSLIPAHFLAIFLHCRKVISIVTGSKF